MGPDTAGRITAASEPDFTSSPSAASFSSSSSSTDHLSFIASTHRSPSASPLCFGAGKLLWRSRAGGARAHVSNNEKKKQEEDAAPRGGDVVGKYLRKVSRRLRRARAIKETPPPPCRGAADDTARERAEALASAIAYCKESLRRRTPTLRPVSPPSLDRWLQGWREEEEEEEVIASAATQRDQRTDSQCTPPPPPPRQAGWLLERQAKATLRSYGSPRPARGEEPPHRSPNTDDYYEFRGEAAAAEATAKPSSPDVSLHRRFSISGSFNEIEFLKTCSGEEEEVIGRHFITIQI